MRSEAHYGIAIRNKQTLRFHKISRLCSFLWNQDVYQTLTSFITYNLTLTYLLVSVNLDQTLSNIVIFNIFEKNVLIGGTISMGFISLGLAQYPNFWEGLKYFHEK